MHVRPYRSARADAPHVFHEDDDCPDGRRLAWFDKVEGCEDCEPCPQCVQGATTRPEHLPAASPAS